MDNVELIDLIRTAIKEELTPMKEDISSIFGRLNALEIKQDMTHRKLDNLEFNTKSMEREIKKDIALIKDGQETLIAVMEAKGILPRVEGQ
ncbi:MAG: hypothetical protein ACRDBO_21405 [Lachnospiraceae bacterium]